MNAMPIRASSRNLICPVTSVRSRPRLAVAAQYCFMNAAVQCMRHTPKLVDAIVDSVGEDVNDGLLQSFALLLQQMDDPTLQPDALAVEGWRDFVTRCGESLPVSNQTGMPLVVPPTSRQEQQDTGEFLDQLIDSLSTEKNKDGTVAMARASSSYSPTRPAAAAEARKDEVSDAVTAAYADGAHDVVHEELDKFGADAWAGRDAAVAPTSRTHLGAMFQGQQLALQRCESPDCGRVTVSSADPFRILNLHLAATKMDKGEDGLVRFIILNAINNSSFLIHNSSFVIQVHLQESLETQHRPHGVSTNDEFCVKNKELCIETRNCVLKTRNFVSKMMHFAARARLPVSGLPGAFLYKDYEFCIKNEKYCTKITRKRGILYYNHTKTRNCVLKMMNSAEQGYNRAARHSLSAGAMLSLFPSLLSVFPSFFPSFFQFFP